MKRSEEQNALFHLWVGQIARHLKEANVDNVSRATVKELVLLNLGNTVELLGTKVAMRSSAYQCAEADLTPHDRRHDNMPMADLLTKIQVWASTDLNLTLESELEKHS